MGFVPLFVQTVKEELMHELRNSLIPLHRSGSPQINRFGELLMDLGIAPRLIESDTSHRIPVLSDLLHKQSEETPGQFESPAPLPSGNASSSLLTEFFHRLCEKIYRCLPR